MSNQLIDYLLSCDFDQDAITEGSSSTESSDWLIDIITTHAPEAKKIMEIGLNLGHSSDKLLTNNYIEYKPLEWLKFKSIIGCDYSVQNGWGYSPVYYIDATDKNDIDGLSNNYNKWFSWNWENTLQIDKSFGNHSIS